MPLPHKHPLRWAGLIAHAAETIIETVRDSDSSIEPSTIQALLETVDAFKSLTRHFMDGDTSFSPAESLVVGLSLDISHLVEDEKSKTKTSSQYRVFTQSLVQTREVVAALLQAARDGLPTDGLTAAAKRALTTLQKTCLKNAAEPIADKIQDILDRLDSGPPHETLKESFDALWNDAEQHAKNLAADPGSPTSHPAATTATNQSSASAANAASSSSIRVDTDKLDRLMRAVGELLVARNMFPLLAEKAIQEFSLSGFGKEIKEAGTSISHIADDLQASIMAIRMMPIKNVFQKFPRMVRDISKALGKEVELILEGEATELDKTVLDQIGDPLVHLVRNAVDHGIEKPDDRAQENKNLKGNIWLRAYNSGSNVIIEIEDDGKGMQAQKLIAKALEKKIITPEQAATMDEQQAYALIFHAGFSTAEKITDVSGRGVGMDVVRNNIRALHGSVDIKSSPGKGSKFSIILPTSLLVSKGILVAVNEQEFIFPITHVTEIVKLPRERIQTLPQGRIAQIRDSVLPIKTMDEAMNPTTVLAPMADKPEIPVAIIKSGSGQIGVMVDKFVNEVEVIVKPLTGGLTNLKTFQGATIMGDGRVVLVINPLAIG